MSATPPAHPARRPDGFAEAVAAGPLVLDGGMSNELAGAGHDLSDALWSARLLADEPDAITRAHQAYFEAGASVAITASYQASFEGFARRGVGRAEAARLLALSVELAREAARRDRTGRRLWVAASVGPYGAVLADGSEYRGRYGLSVAELEAFHRPRLEVLAAAGPDVLALETVPDTDEARALLRAVRGLGVPAWLSYSVEYGPGEYGRGEYDGKEYSGEEYSGKKGGGKKHGGNRYRGDEDGAGGGRTRAGQSLEEAFALAADCPEIVAVGVNCCTPADADRAVAVAARLSGKPVVVYPNSGERWDAAARDWRGGPTFRAARVAGWLADGARLVGGCCRVGPREIAGLAGEVGRATAAGGSHGPDAPGAPVT